MGSTRDVPERWTVSEDDEEWIVIGGESPSEAEAVARFISASISYVRHFYVGRMSRPKPPWKAVRIDALDLLEIDDPEEYGGPEEWPPSKCTDAMRADLEARVRETIREWTLANDLVPDWDVVRECRRYRVVREGDACSPIVGAVPE